jgi:hypothetical protein
MRIRPRNTQGSTLVRGLRLLVLRALRACQREAPGRRPEEAEAGPAGSGSRRAGPASHDVSRAGAGFPIRARRDEVISAIGRVNLIDVGPPTSSPGCSWPRRIRPTSTRSAAGTYRARRTYRGRRPRPRTDVQARRRAAHPVGRRVRSGFRPGDHRLLPDWRGSAHTWFVRHELLGLPDVKTTTDPGPRTDH